MTDSTDCQVWWATLDSVHPRLAELCDPVEAGRRERYLSAADRDRFTLGCAVIRLVLGRRLGVPPTEVPLRRDCRCGAPHGRPRLTVPGPRVSVSHSGHLVVVAISSDPVGVDVQEMDPKARIPVDRILSRRELAGFRAVPPARRELGMFTVWSRKEAILKATGDGLTVPMTGAEVTRPDRAAGLLGLAHRPGTTARLADLPAPPGYVAAVAVLGTGPVRVEHRDANSLLAAA
jgi:4'-phosphopantetheinyl transferase